MQSNVVVVTSTVNTTIGLIPPNKRYEQTLETIQSIRQKVSNSFVILIDNSIEQIPNEQEAYLASLCDFYLYIGDRQDVQRLNKDGVKGAGEAYTLMVAFDFIEKHLKPKRIYKICGRYTLSDNFDASFHEKLTGKFCFKTRDCHEGDEYPFFHTRFWSACGTILDDVKLLVSNSWRMFMEKQNMTIEQTMYANMNFDKLVEVETIDAQGFIAPWNILIKD